MGKGETRNSCWYRWIWKHKALIKTPSEMAGWWQEDSNMVKKAELPLQVLNSLTTAWATYILLIQNAQSNCKEKILFFFSKLVKVTQKKKGFPLAGLSNLMTSTWGLGGRDEEKERKQTLARDRKESLERLWNAKCALEV